VTAASLSTPALVLRSRRRSRIRGKCLTGACPRDEGGLSRVLQRNRQFLAQGGSSATQGLQGHRTVSLSSSWSSAARLVFIRLASSDLVIFICRIASRISRTAFAESGTMTWGNPKFFVGELNMTIKSVAAAESATTVLLKAIQDSGALSSMTRQLSTVSSAAKLMRDLDLSAKKAAQLSYAGSAAKLMHDFSATNLALSCCRFG